MNRHEAVELRLDLLDHHGRARCDDGDAGGVFRLVHLGPTGDQLVGATWASISSLCIQPWFDRVASASNATFAIISQD